MSRRKPIQLAWGIRREGRSLWTRNAVKGISVRGEKRKKDSHVEWRHWDPTKSKVAASLLNAVNLPELITSSQKDYEALAIELATNPKKLKAIKDKLAKNLPSAPLFDTPLFTKHLESAYKTMYDRHHKGLEPDHIYVEHSS